MTPPSGKARSNLFKSGEGRGTAVLTVFGLLLGLGNYIAACLSLSHFHHADGLGGLILIVGRLSGL